MFANQVKNVRTQLEMSQKKLWDMKKERDR